jgi:hypothetical protein
LYTKRNGRGGLARQCSARHLETECAKNPSSLEYGRSPHRRRQAKRGTTGAVERRRLGVKSKGAAKRSGAGDVLRL